MGRAGIEPATPGFSVGVSLLPQSHASHLLEGGCDDGGLAPILQAQQKAQYTAELKGVLDQQLLTLVKCWSSLPGSTRKLIIELAGQHIEPPEADH